MSLNVLWIGSTARADEPRENSLEKINKMNETDEMGRDKVKWEFHFKNLFKVGTWCGT